MIGIERILFYSGWLTVFFFVLGELCKRLACLWSSRIFSKYRAFFYPWNKKCNWQSSCCYYLYIQPLGCSFLVDITVDNSCVTRSIVICVMHLVNIKGKIHMHTIIIDLCFFLSSNLNLIEVFVYMC